MGAGAGNLAELERRLSDSQAALARLGKLYDSLGQINKAIVQGGSRESLLARVCDSLVALGGFRMAWIGWHDAAHRRILPLVQSGDTDGFLDSITILTDDTPEGGGPAGTAFREGRPYIAQDMLGDPRLAPWRAEIARRQLRACATFLIREAGRPMGVLTVYADQPQVFGDKEIALLEGAAADISFALDNFARDADRRRAEEAAQREKLFSEAIIDSLPGILYLYDEQGRFLRWNRNFEAVSGYAAGEIGGMSPLEFFAADEKERLRGRIAEVFRSGASSVEASLVTRDGRAIPYYFTGRRILFEDRPCLIGVGIDISERKRAELALCELNESLEGMIATRTAQLRAALDRAESADRTKSAFLATMSHELRTPLNSIIGFTGIVLQGLAGPLNAEQTKQLGMVRGSARHLLALINDVLDISKIEAGELAVDCKPFPLGPAIERVVQSVRPMAEGKGLRLEVLAADAPADLVSDQRRVEQVLLNLLSNAVKFTRQGGVALTVETVACPEGGAAPAGVRFRVRDTGIGIRREDQEKLFQPFRQLDTGLAREHEGTGLGLAICRRLADLLGGEIGVDSEWGRGSTFTFALPLDGRR
jgi:PAS domain S-box-containing protein